MRLLLATILLALSLHAEVIKVNRIYYAYSIRCYTSDMQLSFYEIQGLANNNTEIEIFVTDNYADCNHGTNNTNDCKNPSKPKKTLTNKEISKIINQNKNKVQNE